MKYGMFIGEMLADRTRHATLKDLQAHTQQELLTTLREAMGEPTSELSQKFVVIWAVDHPMVPPSSILTDFERVFEQQRVENPLVRRFEEKGFKVDCTLQEKTVCLFVTHHGSDHLVSGLKEFLRKKESAVGEMNRLPSRHRDAGSYSSEFMEAMWGELFAGADLGVSWAGRTEEEGSDDVRRNPNEPERIRIGLRAYLRSMWTLIWTAIFHPFTTTVIDLSTGKRIAELSVPFHEWERSRGKEEPVNG
jgi:hypothetical protein